ncbi:hypothetical protein BO94DRAFT_549076 [Aspergillus sclerotioniger CBS 115572]|uniref:Uncharacterized protein n=1 Tax=Aspergillus sclerotioniger CBS 115572 TaxID=1450535 RepID=A0A317VW92_9EURO|nr:hypothetical protein BO94DRAFT_549076 [Aspergillus sclerotioniger CBS 115572]PWY77262.1 hypothetical protein BO94DRAFT_549076 [Aspergillus sclerotioniger CBS 115572]
MALIGNSFRPYLYKRSPCSGNILLWSEIEDDSPLPRRKFDPPDPESIVRHRTQCAINRNSSSIFRTVKVVRLVKACRDGLLSLLLPVHRTLMYEATILWLVLASRGKCNNSSPVSSWLLGVFWVRWKGVSKDDSRSYEGASDSTRETHGTSRSLQEMGALCAEAFHDHPIEALFEHSRHGRYRSPHDEADIVGSYLSMKLRVVLSNIMATVISSR